jgi:hypothetical protein
MKTENNQQENNNEENTYLVEGEFAFKSYHPEELKPGMHFLSSIKVGVLEPEHLFFTLEHVPEDEDLFMSLYGAPVHVFIMSADEEMETYAEPKQIGWFNSPDSEVLLPITDREMNIILNEHDGYLDVECDETGDIILYEGKVIISYLSEDEEEDTEV